MKLELYNIICKSCDKILKSPDSNLVTVAIPWLHIVRPHPIFLEKYLDLLTTSKVQLLKKLARSKVLFLIRIAKTLFSKCKPWHSVGEMPKKCDILIISHIVNSSFTQQKGDFYFGNVATELKQSGIIPVIALINSSNEDSAVLANNWRKANTSRIIFSSFLNTLTEIQIYFGIKFQSQRINKLAQINKNKFEKKLFERAAVEAYSDGTFFAVRLGEQIKKLVKLLQPEAIIVTYEGHSWERIAFSSARTVSPNIKCIGYQHSALFYMQHAIQRRLPLCYEPNFIFTSGTASLNIFRRKFTDIQIKCLGSFRSFNRNVALHDKARTNACLVLPEGLIKECILLFKFSLQCAKNMPDVNFIWRLHPSVTYQELFKHDMAFKYLPSNITISINTLAEDISNSKWSLFRGSTTIVDAVMSGVHPIYLEVSDEITINPLYEVIGKSNIVTTPEDFVDLIKKDSTIGLEEMIKYCESFFAPFDMHIIASILKN